MAVLRAMLYHHLWAKLYYHLSLSDSDRPELLVQIRFKHSASDETTQTRKLIATECLVHPRSYQPGCFRAPLSALLWFKVLLACRCPLRVFSAPSFLSARMLQGTSLGIALVQSFARLSLPALSVRWWCVGLALRCQVTQKQ